MFSAFTAITSRIFRAAASPVADETVACQLSRLRETNKILEGKVNELTGKVEVLTELFSKSHGVSDADRRINALGTAGQ